MAHPMRKQYTLTYKLRIVDEVRALSASLAASAPHRKIRSGALTAVATKHSLNRPMLSKWVRSFGTIKDDSVKRGGKYLHCGWGSVMVGGGRKEHSRINRAPPSLSRISVDFDGNPSILSPSPSMVRCMFLEEEVKLFGLVADQRNRGYAVSPADLREWMLAYVKDPLSLLADAALDVGTEQRRETFTASSRWCTGFMERYRLSIRARTTTRTCGLLDHSDTPPLPLPILSSSFINQTTQNKPKTNKTNKTNKNIFFTPVSSFVAGTDPKIAVFDDFIYRQQTNGLTVKDIYNFDQTRLYFDMSLKKTVHWKGSTIVIIKNTGNESTGFSVGLTCRGDGHRLPPLVVFKGARTGRLAKTVPAQVSALGVGLQVTFQQNAWFDSDVILNECIPQFKSETSGRKVMMVLDSYKAHLTQPVKDAFKNAAIIPAVIPGGYTSKLQPLDIGIIKPFKDGIRRRWTVWMRNSITDASELNADGRRKRPSHAIICSWISSAWNDVDNSVFEAAFRKGLWARRAV